MTVFLAIVVFMGFQIGHCLLCFYLNYSKSHPEIY
jgi:hypothetical protein